MRRIYMFVSRTRTSPKELINTIYNAKQYWNRSDVQKKTLSYYKHLYWINMEVIPHGIQDTQLCFDKPEELF